MRHGRKLCKTGWTAAPNSRMQALCRRGPKKTPCLINTPTLHRDNDVFLPENVVAPFRALPHDLVVFLPQPVHIIAAQMHQHGVLKFHRVDAAIVREHLHIRIIRPCVDDAAVAHQYFRLVRFRRHGVVHILKPPRLGIPPAAQPYPVPVYLSDRNGLLHGARCTEALSMPDQTVKNSVFSFCIPHSSFLFFRPAAAGRLFVKVFCPFRADVLQPDRQRRGVPLHFPVCDRIVDIQKIHLRHFELLHLFRRPSSPVRDFSCSTGFSPP